jgi:predicted enzyme related to lactoylglutathione lyase
MGKHFIAHMDIPTSDPSASSKFYSELFGWKINVDQSVNYFMFQPESGPGGGFVTLDMYGSKVGEVLVYVSTDDIDATLAQAEALGGKTLMPKVEIPGNNGAFAFFADPSGNRIGLYTPPAQ